ncbi:uncharacterized protein DNG_10039 [Cephalotrichum gorgonifer]|uniref:Helicase C-terminal domain-containing protein n=1 Tax=Cephalotrichum gorgonifer TaxID=2041049 RepID=A0AAE8N963_9PEZI|nr:uncharacterized protein DNG_10039 [Cephalotrichum gorgonifer]
MAPRRKRRPAVDDALANKEPKLTKTRKPLSSLADIEVISVPSRTPSPPPVEVPHTSSGGPVLADDPLSGSDPVVHDICFGLVELEVTDVYKKWDPPPESAPVRISFVDNALFLHYEDGGGSAGILMSEPLSRLARECSVTLAATLGPPVSNPPKSTISNVFHPRPVRIVIYGHFEEKDTVASILDAGGLFLQPPDEGEYDLKTTYLNPMYLLRPGDSMPTIGTSSAAPGRGGKAASQDEAELSESQRLRALRVFDEASGPGGVLPLQNSLHDFGSLLAFVGVPPFTTRDQFKFWIAKPILSNRKHSLRTLKTLVRATCLRRTKALPALATALRLPRKTEHVVSVALSPNEREIYEFFKRRSYLLAAQPQKSQPRRRKRKGEDSVVDASKSSKTAGNIIVLISVLRLVCDHGAELLPHAAREAWHNRETQAVNWAMLQTAARIAQSCLVCDRQVHHDGESVIFSHWTGMLDLILEALSPHLRSLGVTSGRIDGSSTLQQRRDVLDTFNSESSCVVMLATIGAVGEGVDLSIASEVHLVEPHWNPMAEAQAVDRVHRIGQSREVKVTRYCVSDSVEEYIQWIQGKKLRLIAESLSSSEHEHGRDKKKDQDEDPVDVRWKRLLDFLQ